MHCTRPRGNAVNEAIIWLTIFVLAVFVGIEVISKVSSTLHTPLMSGANAIHGVILVGAILVAGTADSTPILALSLVAVALAAINMVGGFVVTDRMLVMFRPRRTELRRSWSDDPDLGPAGLSGRRRLLHRRAQGAVLAAYGAPRQPDRRRGRGAGLRDRLRGQRSRSPAADPDRDRGRHRRRARSARTGCG